MSEKNEVILEVSEITPGRVIEFDYTNWQGKKGRRKVKVLVLLYGQNSFHKGPQFLLSAYDLDKSALRMFAVKDMSNVVVL
jgi:hypothetical protein